MFAKNELAQKVNFGHTICLPSSKFLFPCPTMSMYLSLNLVWAQVEFSVSKIDLLSQDSGFKQVCSLRFISSSHLNLAADFQIQTLIKCLQIRKVDCELVQKESLRSVQEKLATLNAVVEADAKVTSSHVLTSMARISSC